MTTVEDIEKAVAELPPKELAAFRAWFERFDTARLDETIERDATCGKLDRIGMRLSPITGRAAPARPDTEPG